MSILTIFTLALGLSMDAFAVAISKGLSMNQIKVKYAAIVGAYFGLFQAGMPVIGLLDYATGAEIRVYPLYFLPLAYLTWHYGRRAAVTVAVFASLVWLASRYLAGNTPIP